MMENTNYTNVSNTSTDILAGDDAFQYEYASTGQRFVHFLVDIVLFYFIFIVIGVVAAITGNESSLDILDDPLGGRLISIVVYILFFTLWEGGTKGRTLGKFITGTKALKKDGSEITWADALKRSLSRIVPFEPLTGFSGHPWHDKWTDTMVVKIRK